jgi:hypothetical protein
MLLGEREQAISTKARQGDLPRLGSAEGGNHAK